MTIRSLFSIAIGFVILSVALVARGQEAATVGHEHPVHAVAFSPDGKFIVSADQHGVTLLLDATTGNVVRRIGLNSATVGIAFTPAGKLATVAGRRIGLYNVITGEREAEFRPDQSSLVTAMALSPDGLWVAVGHQDGKIRVHGLPGGDLAVILPGHTQAVSGLTFSGDGKWLASTARTTDGKVQIWDVSGWRKGRTLQHIRGLMTGAIAASRDGRFLATSSPFGLGATPGVIKIWDAKTGTLLQTLSHASSNISFDSSGKILASAGHHDQEIRLWGVERGTPIGSLAGHRAQPLAVTFGLGDKALVSAGQDREVILWDLATKNKIRSWPGPRIWEWHITGVRKTQVGEEPPFPKAWILSVEVKVKNIGNYGRSFIPTAEILRGDGSAPKGVNHQTTFSAPGIDRILAEARATAAALKSGGDRAPQIQGRISGELATGVPVIVTINPIGTSGVWTHDAEVKFNARSEAATIMLNFSVIEDFHETGLKLRFLEDEKPLVVGGTDP